MLSLASLFAFINYRENDPKTVLLPAVINALIAFPCDAAPSINVYIVGFFFFLREVASSIHLPAHSKDFKMVGLAALFGTHGLHND